MDSDDDDGAPQLSSHALAALQEFYVEQAQRSAPDSGHDMLSVGSVHEDWNCVYVFDSERVDYSQVTLFCEILLRTITPNVWSPQLSQFWYSDETALSLAKEVIETCGENSRIACVSTPSIYQKLKGLSAENVSVYLLEYDRRFSVYGEDFIFYNYNDPLNLPEGLEKHSFDLVIADPPYLSEECLRKTAKTILYLTKGKILLCTGAVMEDLAFSILGLKICKFVPKHTKSLANEFRCYANYPLGLDFHL